MSTSTLEATMTPGSVSVAGAIHPVGDRPVVTVGSAPDNDIVVGHCAVTQHHLRIEWRDGRWWMITVDPAARLIWRGREITAVPISTTAQVHLGSATTGPALVVALATAQPGLAPVPVTPSTMMPLVAPTARHRDTAGGGLDVRGLGLTADGNKTLVRDVEFTARPGTLTAVIGPSGAGKSTMSKIVAGVLEPTTGRVTFDGHDVHADYETMRARIGMVPQHDVLHRSLTLRQALRYAAQLRLPESMSRTERDAVIADVLTELQLSDHVDTVIDTLSGGQQKRASVAMELLTGPPLLILDEPTSGLDPALDRQVMATLRRLADAGRVVLVVTHSVAQLSMCDQVLLLAPGGKTAYVGSPDGVAAAMGTGNWSEIFAAVAADPDTAHRRHLRRAPGSEPPAPRRAPAPGPHPSHRNPARQCGTVARRQVRLILADTGYLAFLVAMPVVLGLLTAVIPGSTGFGVNHSRDTAGEAVQVLIILVVGATFMGAALTVRDLVAERDIFERERAVGLHPGAYLGAKVVVYFAAATTQTAVMIAITFGGKGIPGRGVFGVAPFELFCAVATLACVSTLVGLAISAWVRSNEQTMPLLVIVVISQLVFCGGLFRLTAPVLAQLSWLFPSYWGYAAAGAAVDINAVAPLAPQTTDAVVWEPVVGNVTLSYSALLLIATLLVAVTASRLALTRQNTAPPR